SPMHNMTRLPKGAQVQAPFDGSVFTFKDDRARLETNGNERFVRLETVRSGTQIFRVTKVIGGHHREDFAGIEVASTAPGAALVGDPEDELVLPLSYLIGKKTFRYKGYSVMVRERPYLRAGVAWNKACIFCHNTAPYFSSMLGALAGPGVRTYQGEIVDPLLPEDKRWDFEVTSADRLRDELSKEIGILHGGGPEVDPALSPHDTLVKAVNATQANFGQTKLLEVGIGCESCHGGSRAHVMNPSVLPSFEPRSDFVRVKAASGKHPPRSEFINRTCARCHQVLFTGYPFTWEGGLRSQTPGGSNINSGEARDLLLGNCASEMSCVDCHDPHAKDGQARMRALETTPAGNAVCLRCHEKFRSPAALREHSHHAPEGAGGQCMACHMPKKNMSLESRLTRYHRIGSPTDAARIEHDRPIECALCHADKSVRTILSDVQRLWKKAYSVEMMRALYGDLDENALVATLRLGKPHEQAVAISVLGEARVRSAAPLIAKQLTHAYPLVRGYAQNALEAILGGKSPVDLNRDDALIEAQARRWLASAGDKN
ncbi:MAG: cytochrome c3 family protein, partial [Polyangiaceae bacterium]